MMWAKIIGLWIGLLAFFILGCFYMLKKGYKRDLWVFGCWSALLGVFISVNVFNSTPSQIRFAEWILHLFSVGY
ncbi:MAG: hypothetical protein FWG14_10670 [Peptococcaceae bacterium]|nr:hypothetical protein [Peptococcaceae bacterium]